MNSILLLVLLAGTDWPRFRGPNGSGISTESKDMPAEYGEHNTL